MPDLFVDPLHEQLGSWPLAYIPYGGADYGEITRIASEVGEGDDTAFHAAWTAAAERLDLAACDALKADHVETARAFFLKCACFHGKAYHPLFGAPVDPRLVRSYRRQVEAFNRALSLGDEPSQPLRIPFEQGSMPGYLIPATGGGRDVRPLLIVTNGYDGSLTDMYFAIAVAAARRGYHCLVFEGPGQGEMLIEQGLCMRPDWEVVVRAVVDFALTLPGIDPARIALYGWSLGGYLAPRAASGEHRLAACIADPGQRDAASVGRTFAIKLGATPAEAAHLSDLDEALLARMTKIIAADRKLHWSIVQRGFWVNGATDLRSYLASLEAFTLAGRSQSTRCPTLLTLAEDDPLTGETEALFDELRCPKTLVRFTASQGAGDHCEMGNRSLLNNTVLDWLDDTL